jgi:pimeloyl-ACP methyl ester carboxylesterase
MERRTVSTDVLDIAVEQWGGDGPVVVLLHGFPFDPRSFDAVAPALADAGMRVIVPYLRGFGPTRFRAADTMRSGQQTAIADDVRGLMDALGIERALLAGFDWGGRAACIAAALWPERVRGLLAVGGDLIQNLAEPTRPAPPGIEHLAWHQYYLASARGRRALAEQPAELAAYLRHSWSPNGEAALPEATARSFANPDFAEVASHSYAHRIGAAPGDPRYAALDEALLPPPPIAVPTIVLEGADTKLKGAATADRFPRLIDRRTVPGGHDPAAEAPADFIRAVLDLVAATDD